MEKIVFYYDISSLDLDILLGDFFAELETSTGVS